MDNFLQSPVLNRILLSCVLTTFSISVIPVHICAVNIDINLNDINFAIRIEKLIEKMNRYRDKEESKKLIDTMLEMKFEIEGYTGKKIDIDKQIDQAEREIKAQGGKLKKDQLKGFRKYVKNKEKRQQHRAMYIADSMIYGFPYDAEEEALLFRAAHKDHKDKDEDKDELEVGIPPSMIIGVTVGLCGLFMSFVPIPICQTWGPRCMTWGFGLAASSTITRMDENDKKDKEKR